MSVFRFETSMPFPLTRLTTEVHHTEVKKPSGISYIILVIINESKDKKMKLKDLLVQFGVASDLHAIFANEIHNLINDLEIIECIPYQYNKQHFDEYTIGNFRFTTKGKKIFKEELIPSKNSVEDKEDYWFDPGRNELLTKIPDGIQVGKIERSELPNSFAEQFSFTDNNQLEEYLNSQKGNGICVKKEESITKVNILQQAFFFTTPPIIFEIIPENNEIHFDFNEKSLKIFFDKHYKSEMKSNCLAVKRKFKFSSVSRKVDNIQLSRNIIGIHYPEKYEHFLKSTNQIAITKGNYNPTQRQNVFESSESINMISDIYETIHLSSNKANALAPLEISFNDPEGKGIVELPFLVEVELTSEDVKSILTNLADSFREYKMDNIKDLFTIQSYLSDFTKLTEFYEAFLNDDIENNINVLKSIKDLVNIKVFEDWYKSKATEAYQNYFDVISLDALDYQLAFGNWLLKYLDIPNRIIIKKALDSNHDVEKIEVYDALEDSGFKAKEILGVIDLYPDFISYIIGKLEIKSNSKLFLKIQTLKELFNQLQELSGLHSVDQFQIREDINKKKYRETYSGFRQKLNEVSLSKKMSGEEINVFNEYLSNFDYLNTLYSEEYSASNNPKDINRKQIEKKIKSNDYFSAVVFLSVKMEWLLKEKQKLKGKLFEMINSVDEDILSKNDKELLHLLRKERNNLVHPSEKRINLSEDELRKIIDVVFKEELVQ